MVARHLKLPKGSKGHIPRQSKYPYKIACLLHNFCTFTFFFGEFAESRYILSKALHPETGQGSLAFAMAPVTLPRTDRTIRHIDALAELMPVLDAYSWLLMVIHGY